MKTIQVAKKSVAFEYDFDIDGGAIGAIHTGVYLPGNIVVRPPLFDVITAFTSDGSATVAVKAQGGAVLLASAATPYADYPGAGAAGYVDNILGITGAGLNPVVVVGDEECYVSNTAGELIFDIGTAALTAGKCIVIIEYFQLP